MAIAKAEFTVPVERELESVTLTLGKEEAQYLFDLLGSVGGTGHFRNINKSIIGALHVTDLRFSTSEDESWPFKVYPSIQTRS